VNAIPAGPRGRFSAMGSFGRSGEIKRFWHVRVGVASLRADSIRVVSEYIGQTCALAQYETAPFGDCGGTGTSLGDARFEDRSAAGDASIINNLWWRSLGSL